MAKSVEDLWTKYTQTATVNIIMFYFIFTVLQVTDLTGGGSLRGEGNRLNDLESC